ncbi:MAG: TRAP transporter substrate-binding protein [Rhodobacteraceae bacterium]|nr:TRAP transporter substrate-binding protein [Paracoccaceae bacterium]
MKFTTIGKLVGSAIVAATLATSAAAQDVTLRFHHFLPPQANVPKLVLGKWAEDVQNASGGDVAVEIYPSMQLGGTPPQLIDQARDGIVDVVWTVVGYTPGRFPRTEVFELPFMMTNASAASKAFWQMFESHMESTEFADLKILGTWVHGPGLIHSKDPVASVEDLRGVKIRGGSRTVNNLLVELGATPVGMPVPAVPESLSKGVIDATTIPWEVTAALKVPELVGNHTEFGEESLYTLTFVLAMNKAKYDGMTDAQKAAIDSASGEAFSIYAGTTQQAADDPARKLAVDNGNNIIQLTDAQIAEWKAAAEPIYAAWVADMESKGIDGQALIDEARSLIAEYTE